MRFTTITTRYGFVLTANAFPDFGKHGCNSKHAGLMSELATTSFCFVSVMSTSTGASRNCGAVWSARSANIMAAVALDRSSSE